MKKTIALCLEYPLALRGGVSVLVETLLPALAEQYRLVLVSADTPASLAGLPASGLIARHFNWNPAAISRSKSERLAQDLANAGVALAHFHFGGNYGWGSRMPSRCPIPYLSPLGVRTCSTVHLITRISDGYCGPQKPLALKLALLPAAWLAKVRVLRHLSAEIAVSKDNAAKLRRWYWPMRRKFVQIYHSRLPAAGSRPTGMSREPMILNLGHLAWRKGQRVLCEAFAEVASRHPEWKEWKLWLVGDWLEPQLAESIRELAQARGLADRVSLPGSRSDPAELLARASIYVQPSREEALGLALQEALFAGCAAIGSNVGGIPELIDPGVNGLLVESGDVSQLAKALETLMADASLRQCFGQAATASIIAKGMTLEHMTKRHLELYESILGAS